MRSAGITCVILHDSDRGRLSADLERLLSHPGEWPLLYQVGDLGIFGWRDPAGVDSPEPFPSAPLDLNRAAFFPDESQKAPRQAAEPQARSQALVACLLEADPAPANRPR